VKSYQEDIKHNSFGEIIYVVVVAVRHHF